jgi:hypothetical protein
VAVKLEDNRDMVYSSKDRDNLQVMEDDAHMMGKN